MYNFSINCSVDFQWQNVFMKGCQDIVQYPNPNIIGYYPQGTITYSLSYTMYDISLLEENMNSPHVSHLTWIAVYWGQTCIFCLN